MAGSTLSLAQTDQSGSLNVSKYGPRLAGAGGFINISQNAKKLVFTGTFVAGKVQVRYSGGSLQILRDSDIRKFVTKVEHVTFSGILRVGRVGPCSISPNAVCFA